MTDPTSKTAFLLYLDQEEYFRRLSGDECRELILAIFQYERDHAEPAFTSMLVEMAFIAFKQSLDRNRLKHEHISKIRADVGRKGALAKHGKPGNCQNGLAKGGKRAESESDSDSESESENIPPKAPQGAGAKFKPPLVDDVRQYCEARGNSVDPESFVNFYASKGWMVGKNKMKDWQAAVRTWEKNRNNAPPLPLDYGGTYTEPGEDPISRQIRLRKEKEQKETGR